METRFHELEHESKMGLFKTYSHTSERRGYEADKKRKGKGEIKEAFRKGQGKRQGKSPLYHLKGGTGREWVDANAKTKVAQPQRGGRGEVIPPTKRKQGVTRSCATVGVAKIPRRPPAPSGGGDRQDEKGKNTKNRQSCDTI